jgi:hypothetical protein
LGQSTKFLILLTLSPVNNFFHEFLRHLFRSAYGGQIKTAEDSAKAQKKRIWTTYTGEENQVRGYTISAHILYGSEALARSQSLGHPSHGYFWSLISEQLTALTICHRKLPDACRRIFSACSVLILIRVTGSETAAVYSPEEPTVVKQTLQFLLVLRLRIRTFLGLLDQDLTLFCTDPDPSINKPKN